jgi:hypothetical protein
MDFQTQQAVRIARVLKLSFIIAGAMFIFLAVRIPAKASAQPTSAVELIISIVALAAVGAGFFVPKLIALPSEPSLLASTMSAPVKQWFARCVLSLALFNTCNLFALVLHFLGARVQVVELDFALGMLSLVFWNPGTPH